ncbi:MAG: hypothetical protein L6R40_001370 [Gallowayella cf. fulva]|nr:MAG: hypothetical protein L6R40_001370 [Xanthomendoza cf. fulva]
MSRDFPQSISPQRGSRHNSLASDANIRNFAPVARIMKTALPENAKIAKEAKECMQECVSEFISFITSEASEKCQQEKRKTVNGEDILFAMTSLGFENYAEALKIYLSKYRECGLEMHRTWHLTFYWLVLHTLLVYGRTVNDRCSKTQSARGENQQQRPGSGYGSQGAPAGPSSGSVGSAPTVSSAPTTYHVQQGEGVNSILSPHLEGGEGENAPYGQLYDNAVTNGGERVRASFANDDDVVSRDVCDIFIDSVPQGELVTLFDEPQLRNYFIFFCTVLDDFPVMEIGASGKGNAGLDGKSMLSMGAASASGGVQVMAWHQSALA